MCMNQSSPILCWWILCQFSLFFLLSSQCILTFPNSLTCNLTNLLTGGSDFSSFSYILLYSMQDCPILNEGLVRFLPAAVYALCAGCAPLPLDCKELFPYHSSMDVLVEECVKVHV